MKNKKDKPRTPCVLHDGDEGLPVRLPYQVHDQGTADGCVTHRVHPTAVIVCSVHKRFARLH